MGTQRRDSLVYTGKQLRAGSHTGGKIMKIVVRYFALFRDITGKDQEIWMF